MKSDPHTILHYHAAVVGGGLVGKAAALLLAQQGLRVALIARPSGSPAQVDTEPWDRRMYALSASSQALLERLRIWSALDPARLQRVDEMRVWGDAPGSSQGMLHFSAYAAALPQLAWIVESGHVERTLDTALRFSPGVAQHTQSAVALTLRDEGATVTLDDGATVVAECVVGADGANSPVRSWAGIEAEDHPYGISGVVANFKAEKRHHGTAFQWFLGPTVNASNADQGADGEVLALLPLPDNHLSMVWSASDPHAQALIGLSPQALAVTVQNVADGLVGETTGSLQGVSSAALAFPLTRRRAKRVCAPRVVLVGDAARVIHPLAGQGMNLGLRDVAELGRVFADKEAFRDYGDMRLLRRYERARSSDTLALSLVTDGLQHLFSLTGGVPRELRNAGLRLVSANPPLKRWLVGRALG